MKAMSGLRSAFVRKALPLITPFRGCEPCPARFLPLAQRRTNVLAADFQVDVIYTWVDGNDPVLAGKKASYLPSQEHCGALIQGESLFRDNDELRFSLRSLELHAPWIRHIYIVTDGQRPAWLADHPKISVVDHTEIIPHEYLPTFSSRVIEAFLHRIPDLAEHYIYFNDDVFLADTCRPEDFFTANGLPYLFTDWRRPRRVSYQKAATPHTRSHVNVCHYLSRRGLRSSPALITAHGPFPQTKTNAKDAYLFYEEAIQEFAQDKFRSFRGMVFYCHMLPLWSYALRRGVPCDLSYYYIDVKRPDRRFYFQALLREKGMNTLPLFFCLNDTHAWEGSTGWQKDMRAFLQACYPYASRFENPCAGGEKSADTLERVGTRCRA